MQYTILYYNESHAEWRGTGSGNFTDIKDARKRMRALADQCNRCVSFKLAALPA